VDLVVVRGVHDLAAPAEPQAAGGVQHVGERDRKAAGGGLARIRDAVGNDDEAAQ
jgi:hypothetical protein